MREREREKERAGEYCGCLKILLDILGKLDKVDFVFMSH